MKRCPNCNQVFNDEYTFCLTDGATLVADYANQEVPTVVHNFPTSQPQSGSNKTVIFAVIGFLTLFLGVIIAGLIVYALMKNDEPQSNANIATSNLSVENSANDNSEIELSSKEQDLNEREENLKREEERLKNEKKKIEDQKNKSTSNDAKTDTKTESSGSTALVFRPPTNVRNSPNGSIQCVIRSSRYVTILGSTGVIDHNGLWYYTNACGSQGVIHSSQIKF